MVMFKTRRKNKEVITTLDLGNIVFEKQAVPTPNY